MRIGAGFVVVVVALLSFLAVAQVLGQTADDSYLCYPSSASAPFSTTLDGWSLTEGCSSNIHVDSSLVVAQKTGVVAITATTQASSVCGLFLAFGQIKSTHSYCPGYYAVNFKAAASAGVVNNVLEISRATDSFSIGMAITGASTSSITLYQSIAGAYQSQVVALPYDTSANTHNYAIYWDYYTILYFVDGEPIGKVSINVALSGPTNLILSIYPAPGYQGTATAYWSSFQLGNNYQIDTPYGEISVTKSGSTNTLRWGVSTAVNLTGGAYRIHYAVAPAKKASPTWVELGTSTQRFLAITLTKGSYLFRVRAETGTSVSNWSVSSTIKIK